MKRLQNKIAGSRLSLPTMAIVGVAVWMLAGAISQWLWLQFACFVFSSYIMVELNTTFVLLRTYSRMVSCAFIMLYCCSAFLFPRADCGIIALCYAASLMPFFHSYQDRLPTGWTFYAFLPIGIASLVWQQVLFFLPVEWMLMVFCLRSMSWRTFFASILGIIAPYWFVMLYFIYAEDWETPMQHFASMADFSPIFAISEPAATRAFWNTFGFQRVASFLFIVTLFTIGSVHHWRTKFLDRVNTRMYYDVFILNGIAAIVFAVLQPQYFDLLLTVLIVCTSPVIAHFVTHTHKRITNITFIAILALALALIVFNILMPLKATT